MRLDDYGNIVHKSNSPQNESIGRCTIVTSQHCDPPGHMRLTLVPRKRGLGSSRLHCTIAMKHIVKTRRDLAADKHSIIFDICSLIQEVQVQKGHVAKPFGVALDGGLLESLQVWFSLHHLDVVLTLRAMVQDGEADGALEWPGQLPIKSSLHGVDKHGDEV